MTSEDTGARSPAPDSRFDVAALARLIGGEVDGDPDRPIDAIAGVEDAGPRDVTFLVDENYRRRLPETSAAAVIVAREFDPPSGTSPDVSWIRVDDVPGALSAAIDHFHPPTRPQPGVARSARVASDARVGEGVHVGPGAVIGAGAEVGEGTVVGPVCVLAPGVRIGADCRLHASVSVYEKVRLGDRVIVHSGVVLGSDGFGYVQDGRRHRKVRQVGGLVVEDDVEIGANSCVDRGTFGDTRIGRGTKIDNQVQIGHNCRIGRHCILCGQVGLGGSTVMEDGAVAGGQVGIRGHITVGQGAMLAGGTGVTNDVAPGSRVAGYPHLEVRRWRRAMAVLRNLPELLRRVRRLERRNEPRDGDDGDVG